MNYLDSHNHHCSFPDCPHHTTGERSFRPTFPFRAAFPFSSTIDLGSAVYRGIKKERNRRAERRAHALRLVNSETGVVAVDQDELDDDADVDTERDDASLQPDAASAFSEGSAVPLMSGGQQPGVVLVNDTVATVRPKPSVNGQGPRAISTNDVEITPIDTAAATSASDFPADVKTGELTPPPRSPILSPVEDDLDDVQGTVSTESKAEPPDTSGDRVVEQPPPYVPPPTASLRSVPTSSSGSISSAPPLSSASSSSSTTTGLPVTPRPASAKTPRPSSKKRGVKLPELDIQPWTLPDVEPGMSRTKAVQLINRSGAEATRHYTDLIREARVRHASTHAECAKQVAELKEQRNAKGMSKTDMKEEARRLQCAALDEGTRWLKLVSDAVRENERTQLDVRNEIAKLSL